MTDADRTLSSRISGNGASWSLTAMSPSRPGQRRGDLGRSWTLFVSGKSIDNTGPQYRVQVAGASNRSRLKTSRDNTRVTGRKPKVSRATRGTVPLKQKEQLTMTRRSMSEVDLGLPLLVPHP